MSGFDIPAGFDGATRAADGEPIPPGQDPERDLKDFSVFVFNSAQATWQRTFAEQGRDYDRAKLVLYRSASTRLRRRQLGGRPVLLPGRPSVYLDLSFYRDMERQLRRAATSRGRT